ncbi:MAG: ABC transporter substrate-binding protein [Candidatus Ancillula sp.]|jgi:D-methionine transport system substrate-binding protein|nr:ABC transporter substrate-binding protein [Candidatus Ancillula sp.]
MIKNTIANINEGCFQIRNSIKNSTSKIVNILFSLMLVMVMMFSLGALTSCGKANSGELGSSSHPVKIGVVGSSRPQWIKFKSIAQNAGIYVDIIDFTDYMTPNPALDEGQIDINEFQHILFLAKYNVDSGKDLTPIGATVVSPICLYGDTAKNITKLDDLQQGDQIAIPNDGTNQSRALKVLEAAGLIKFVDPSKAILTPADIDTANSKVTVDAVDAAQVPTLIKDKQVKAVVANDDFAKYLSDKDLNNVLYRENAESEAVKPYVNVWVTTKANKDNAVLKKLVDLFTNSEEIQNALVEDAGGADKVELVGKDYDPEQLGEILTQQEDVYKNGTN